MAQYNKNGYKAQGDIYFADNTNEDIDASDIDAMVENTADSVAFTADENIFSEDNILGEIDHTTEFGTTGFNAYSNTSEVAPTVHVYCDDGYAIGIENVDNSDADTKRWVLGQDDNGKLLLRRISESGGTDTANTVLTFDEDNLSTFSGKITHSGNGIEITRSASSFQTTTIRNTHASGGNMLFLDIENASPDNNGTFFLRCDDSTATRAYIYSDGDLQNHDNSYGGISDINLKTNIHAYKESQWDDIKKLASMLKTYKFKTDVETYGDDAKRQLGLIAQEIQKICPGLVKEKNGEGYLGIKYSIINLKLLKAFGEAQKRIEKLESK